MIVAKKRLPVSPLKIAVIKNASPAKASMLYPIKPEEKKILPYTEAPAPPIRVSFDEWNMPVQQHGYIKGRENDFL